MNAPPADIEARIDDERRRLQQAAEVLAALAIAAEYDANDVDVSAWVIFFGFVNTHQRHARHFRGASQHYLLALNMSVLFGSIVGLGLLGYYFMQVAWVLARRSIRGRQLRRWTLVRAVGCQSGAARYEYSGFHRLACLSRVGFLHRSWSACLR